MTHRVGLIENLESQKIVHATRK